MSLETWRDNGWIRSEPTSASEIEGLLRKIDEDIRNAVESKATADWRLAMAYTACLVCAETALRACGYRVAKGNKSHESALDSLRFTIQLDDDDIVYLKSVKQKRHLVQYDATGITTDTEVVEVIELAARLRTALKSWLSEGYSHLIK